MSTQVHYTTSEAMTEVASESVDLVFTSPPYWNMKDYGTEDQIGAEPYTEYLERLAKVWAECFRVARPGAVMIINVKNMRHRKVYYPIAFDLCRTMPLGWSLWDTMFWYIPNAMPQSHYYQERLLDSKVEFLLMFIKGATDDYKCHKPRVEHSWASDHETRVGKLNPDGRCLGNLLRIPAYKPPNLKQRGHHIAAFPEELPAFFIETYTDAGDTVLDPFTGSGTVLKVARNMGRSGVGYEINEQYQPLIDARVAEDWHPPDWKELDNLWAHKRQESRRDPLNNAPPGAVLDIFAIEGTQES